MNRYVKNHGNTSLAENSSLNNVKFRGTDLIGETQAFYIIKRDSEYFSKYLGFMVVVLS